MIDITKKYQTRDGRPVRLLCVDRRGCFDRSVVALVGPRGGGPVTEESIASYYPDGRDFKGKTTQDDLVEIVETTYEYMNVYDSAVWLWWTKSLDASKEKASAPVRRHHFVCRLRRTLIDGKIVKIEVYDG